MNCLKNVLFNPEITGHAFVQPAYSMITTMHSSWQMATSSLAEIPFVLKFRNRVPRSIGESTKMSIKDIGQLRIRYDDYSDRLFLRGKKFTVEEEGSEWVVKLISDFSPQQHTLPSDGWIFAMETLKCTAVFAGAFVCAAVSIPILFPLFVAGCAVKASFSDQYFKRPLRVKKIDPVDYTTVAKIAREWDVIAKKKGRVTSESGIFDDCCNISKLVSQCLEHPQESDWLFDTAFVCEDEKKHIQAVALIDECGTCCLQSDEAYVKLVHIVTHPHNIRSSVNRDEYERVEGSGTALIKAIAQQTMRGIYLESISSAIPFYQKLGFEKVSKNDMAMIEELGCTPMILTAEKVKKLVRGCS